MAPNLTSAQPDRTGRRPWFTLASYLLAAACLGVLIWWASRGDLSRLTRPHWVLLALAVALTPAYLASLAGRCGAMISFLSGRPAPPFRELLYASAFGLTSGLFLSPGVGQALGRPAVLRERTGLSLGLGAGVALAEALLDIALALVLMWPVIGRAVWGGGVGRWWYPAVFAALLLIFCAMAALRLSSVLDLVRRFSIGLAGLGGRRLSGIRERLIRSRSEAPVRGAETARDGRAVAWWTLAKTILIPARLAVLSLAFGLALPWEGFFVGLPLVQAGLVVSITPGGLGFLDGGWLAVFALFGAAAAQVALMLLALRLLNYTLFPLLTLVLRLALGPAGKGNNPAV